MNRPAPPQPGSGLTRVLPGLALLRQYKAAWLFPDIVAGVSVCVVMIPAVIAYAGLMGIAPQHGLYAALVPLLVYPLFGSSRQVIVGPDIAISLLVASAIIPLGEGDPGRLATLGAAIAGLCGLFLLVGARARIGAVAEFLSKPVLVGYMTGAALILVGSQLDKLFGIRLDHNDFFPRLAELGSKLHQTHVPTFVIGLSLLAAIVLLRRLAPRVPPALVAVVLALIAVPVLKLPERGVAVIGAFPHGLPTFGLPLVSWKDVHTLLPAAMGIALLTYTEGILLARAFASKNGYEVNANQELNALGLADVAVSLFQGFAVTGSQSRTTINDSAGGKTPLSSVVAAVSLALFLLFFASVLERLPTVALAAVLIYGGFTLVEFDAMRRIYRFYPESGALAAVTTLGVLAVGVIPGILLGVALSLLGLINRLSHPPDAVLSEVPGHGFHDLGEVPPQPNAPDLIVYRFYAPLLFSNASYFLERARYVIAHHQEPVKWFILDAQAITDVDVTAAEALHALHKELKEQGIELKMAHANRPLRQILERTGLAQELKAESFYPSVHECIDALKARPGQQKAPPGSAEGAVQGTN